MVFGSVTSSAFTRYIACPEERFNDLCKHQVARFTRSLKEINIAFTPYEQQVQMQQAMDALYTHASAYKPVLTMMALLTRLLSPPQLTNVYSHDGRNGPNIIMSLLLLYTRS
jgi:hypothetical protein